MNAPIRRFFIATLLAITSHSTVHAQHSGDVWVAKSAANQLKIGGFDLGANLILLAPTGEGDGWVNSNPGLDHLSVALPEQDLFPLDAGCRINLEVVQLDPGLKAIQVGTFVTIDDPGERFVLRPAGPNLHEHPLWFIDSTDADFDPSWGVWHGAFRLVDTGSTGYSPSAPFTMKFINRDMLAGDANCDGNVSVSDIGPFVLALSNPALYATNFPDCDALLADLNDDGLVTVSDIGLFVAALAG